MADRIIMVASVDDEKQLQQMLGVFYERIPEPKPKKEQYPFWEHSPNHKKNKK